MGWIDVAHNWEKWWVLLNTVMNFWVPYNVESFLTSWGHISFWKRALL